MSSDPRDEIVKDKSIYIEHYGVNFKCDVRIVDGIPNEEFDPYIEGVYVGNIISESVYDRLYKKIQNYLQD